MTVVKQHRDFDLVEFDAVKVTNVQYDFWSYGASGEGSNLYLLQPLRRIHGEIHVVTGMTVAHFGETASLAARQAQIENRALITVGSGELVAIAISEIIRWTPSERKSGLKLLVGDNND